MNRDGLMIRVIWVALAALVALAYANGLEAPFVYDDKIEVIGNETIRLFDEWQAVLGYNASRALLIFTYAWNFDRFEFDPFGYHVTTLIVHLLAVGAALGLAKQVGQLAGVRRPALAAGLAVAMWALHPMVTESVTYTTGRSESLCGLFVFLSLWGWAAALQVERSPGGKAAWSLRAASVGAMLFAATSKEVGAALPAALFALEWAFAPRAAGGRRQMRWAAYVPLVAFLAFAAWARLAVAGQLLPQEVDRSLGVQLTTSAWVWLRYLGLWLAPIGQTLFHHQDDILPLSLHGVGAWAGWLGLVGLGVAAWRWRPAAGWALVAAAIFLVPSTSFVSLKEHMAEHRAYQTGLYLSLAVAWAVADTRLARPLAAMGVVCLPVLVWATHQRNAVWGSEVALWQEAAAGRPDVADAWYGLGDAHRFAREFDAASEAYQRAAKLDPDHLDAWNNLGISRAELGDLSGARSAWQSALRRRPSYCKAHNNLGSLAVRRSEWPAAVAELQSTLAYCPDDVIAHYLLGNIYYGPRRDRERARVHYEAVIALAPTFDHAPEVKRRLLELTW